MEADQLHYYEDQGQTYHNIINYVKSSTLNTLNISTFPPSLSWTKPSDQISCRLVLCVCMHVIST